MRTRNKRQIQFRRLLGGATIAIIFAATCLGAAASAAAMQASAADAPRHSLFVTLKLDGRFNRWIAAIEVAGLTDTLKGSGPFTVFAATDEAFARLPADVLDRLLAPESRERLRAVLAHHIVAARLPASDVQAVKEVQTLRRRALTITTVGEQLKVEEAVVTHRDIPASNGLIHGIDTLLISE